MKAGQNASWDNPFCLHKGTIVCLYKPSLTAFVILSSMKEQGEWKAAWERCNVHILSAGNVKETKSCNWFPYLSPPQLLNFSSALSASPAGLQPALRNSSVCLTSLRLESRHYMKHSDTEYHRHLLPINEQWNLDGMRTGVIFLSLGFFQTCFFFLQLFVKSDLWLHSTNCSCHWDLWPKKT